MNRSASDDEATAQAPKGGVYVLFQQVVHGDNGNVDLYPQLTTLPDDAGRLPDIRKDLPARVRSAARRNHANQRRGWLNAIVSGTRLFPKRRCVALESPELTRHSLELTWRVIAQFMSQQQIIEPTEVLTSIVGLAGERIARTVQTEHGVISGERCRRPYDGEKHLSRDNEMLGRV